MSSVNQFSFAHIASVGTFLPFLQLESLIRSNIVQPWTFREPKCHACGHIVRGDQLFKTAEMPFFNLDALLLNK